MRARWHLVAALVIAWPSWSWAQAEAQHKNAVLRFMLLAHAPVQADLQLAQDQVQRVRDFAARQRKVLQALAGATEAEARKQLADVDRASERFMSEVLKPDQARRLRQISFQVGGPLAFRDPDITNSLQLTADQKTKIQGIEDEARRQLRELLQAGGNRDDARRKALDVLNKSREKLIGLLTSEQVARWEKLIGKPFTGELPAGIPGVSQPTPP
jgi:hypothetical protein